MIKFLNNISKQFFVFLLIVCVLMSCRERTNNYRITKETDVIKSCSPFPDSIELRYWLDNCSLLFFSGPTVFDLLYYPISQGYTGSVVIKDSLSIYDFTTMLCHACKDSSRMIYPSNGLPEYKSILQDVDFAILMNYKTHIDTLAGAWGSIIIQDSVFDYYDYSGGLREWVSTRVKSCNDQCQ